MASPWWDEALERLKAIQATHVEEKCAPMAVWVRLSFVLPIYSVTLIIGRPLMQNTFPLCQQRPEQHDRACGYAHGDRRCWSQWTVLTENDRYVRDLSKKSAPLYIFAHNKSEGCYQIDLSNPARFLDPPSCRGIPWPIHPSNIKP